MKTNIAIIGGGPAGLTCAIIAKRNTPELNITIYEKNDIGSTLLPTGGGRCNLSHYDTDIKNFVQNYPRGEKFLYSIFNRFFIEDTIEFFNSLGIETYTQEDKRIFPKSNKSLDVIFALKNEVKRLGISVENAQVNEIKKINDFFYINGKTFNKVVIAVGGRKSELINKTEHTIIEQKPALCSLEIKEKFLQEISGVSIKNIYATAKFGNKSIKLADDILFTHKGISGPLAYKISSIFSQSGYSSLNPIVAILDFTNGKEINLQKLLDTNSKKEILNFISEFMPKSLAKLLLNEQEIEFEKKCHQINKEEKRILQSILTGFTLNITNPLKEGEIVSSGGIKLSEINPQTMESKLTNGLYFCGEVIDVDGFCGGYNLQNCWSTGFVAGINL